MGLPWTKTRGIAVSPSRISGRRSVRAACVEHPRSRRITGGPVENPREDPRPVDNRGKGCRGKGGREKDGRGKGGREKGGRG
ncbi:hypothetical protein GCM10011578_065570 [Streptomyces fuscichromogenes]|uniref:Uncharacterized protein n=1 Tax=Streptomyces fuscichromogenes TaxID=1324013 RepID=A0A917XJ95_9ACTN|nr:hypothetical protein GCM10011578_065570 [Streptomyces fuscichromogenes]